MKLTKIRREHDRARGVNALLAPFAFVDDQTFVTKSGALGVVYRVTGLDYEGMDDAARRRHVHQFEAALRGLDHTYRVYQYLCKRPSEGGLYALDLYCVLLADPLKIRRVGWSSPHTVTLLDADLERGLVALHHTAQTFEAHTAAVGLVRLGKAEAFQFFRRLVNDTDTGARLKYDIHVDYFMADAALECHRDHLVLGTTRLKVLTMKEAPASTFALMLADLYALPAAFIACLEWQRIPVEKSKRTIHTMRRHFHNKRTSLMSHIGTDATRPAQMLVDHSADAVVAQLGTALTEMEVDGHFFGWCSLTLVLSGPNEDETAAAARRLLAAHDGAFIVETYNQLNAWAAIVPGNGAYNLRRLELLETHAADLSFLFTVDQGVPLDLVGRPPLLTLATQQQTPYRYHLHVRDVGHTVVLGATGSGKTTLLNRLVDEAQQYDPRTIIFDLGHGYRELAARQGGRYLSFGLDSGVAINPFATTPTPDALHVLHAFCKVLIESRDYTLSDDLNGELYESLTNLYVLPPHMRRLGTLASMLPRPLTARLANWVEGGRYGRLFDHVTDTLSLHPFQVLEFGAIRDYPDLIEPLLFAVLHRVSVGLSPSTLTLCVMDEAWRFIQHPTLRAYVQMALKTWRKQNGALLLATQSVEDFADAELLRTVVESCPTALLLANPALDEAVYADLFKLNAVELDLLRHLRPRGQVLLKRDGLAKVLDVSPLKETVYA